MDKLAAMQTFSLVAKTQNFAAAARELGMSRSQINKQVIWLEDHLSVALFNRTTRKVSLTSMGQAYLERVESILADVKEAENQVQSEHAEPVGDLKINAPMSFGTLHLSQAIVDFMKLYPDLRVQLHLSDDKLDPVAGQFDMTLRIATPSEPLALIEHEVVKIKRLLCVAPEFIKKFGEPKTLDELRKLPCLHYGNLPSGSAWILLEEGKQQRVQVNGILCSNNAEVLRDAALAGMGVALLPTFIAGQELQSGRLVSVLHQYHAPELYLNLIYPPNRHLSQRIRLFVKFIQARFGETPVWDLVS